MQYLILIGGGLFAASAGYTWHLSRMRPQYEPHNTHWVAFWGFGLIEAAFLALCLAGPLPFFGDLPVEAFYGLFLLSWIAYIPIMYWREREKRQQLAKLDAGRRAE